MPSAYVLINTEIGAENQVLTMLKEIHEIVEAHVLWGIYDIIVNVKAESVEALKQIVYLKIGKIGKINSKLMMIVEDVEKPMLNIEVRVAPKVLVT